MEKIKLWFILHDGKVAVSAFQTMTEVTNFLLLADEEDKHYVFALGTPAAAKIAANPDLEEDPKLEDFSCITVNGMSILFDPEEEMMKEDVPLLNAFDRDWIETQLKELYGDLDMEKVILEMLPKVPKIVVPDQSRKKKGLILPTSLNENKLILPGEDFMRIVK